MGGYEEPYRPLPKQRDRVTSVDPINSSRRRKPRPVEKAADIEREFARQDFINMLYRDTQDQSWRNRTRRGRAAG